jgi:hypothetical protein
MLNRQLQVEISQAILHIQKLTNEIRNTIASSQITIIETKDAIRQVDEMLKLVAAPTPMGLRALRSLVRQGSN